MPVVTVTLQLPTKKRKENIYTVKIFATGPKRVVPDKVHTGNDPVNDPLLNGKFTVVVTFTDDTTKEEELEFEEGSTNGSVFIDADANIRSVEVLIPV